MRPAPPLSSLLSTTLPCTVAAQYMIGANAYWMPAAVSFSQSGSVDAALDGLQVCVIADTDLTLSSSPSPELIVGHIFAATSTLLTKHFRPGAHVAVRIHLHAPILLQRLGARLLRLWAFNINSPSAPGVYSDSEMR